MSNLLWIPKGIFSLNSLKDQLFILLFVEHFEHIEYIIASLINQPYLVNQSLPKKIPKRIRNQHKIHFGTTIIIICLKIYRL